ncbi:CHAT domain-containing protein [Mycobacterium colombiense]
MAIVNRRLQRVESEHDLAAVTEPGAYEDAVQLHQTLAPTEVDLRVLLTLGWFYWHRSNASKESTQELQYSISLLTTCLIYGAGPLPDCLLPAILDSAVPTAVAHLQRVMEASGGEFTTGVVELWRRIVSNTTSDCPSYWNRWFFLGVALRVRFERTGDVSDINEAIEIGRAVMAAVPTHHPSRPTVTRYLATALRLRSEHVGDIADLNEAIENCRAAVEATTAGGSDWANSLSDLALGLRMRFDRTDDLVDLNEAISNGRAVLQALTVDHPNWAVVRTNLGTALQSRFGRTGEVADLREAIEHDRAALEATPNDAPERAGRLSNLGIALRARFERTGDPTDIDDAVTTGRASVAATQPGDPYLAGRLSNLGVALRLRFERTGDTTDLNEGIENSRAAATAAPSDHPGRARWLSHLANALEARFERTGDPADLNEAIANNRAAVDATAPGNPERAGWLSNLGATLYTRFLATDDSEDLDEAIENSRAAVQATPADHAERAGKLSNYGNKLRMRFERTGNVDDVNEAVEYSEAALEATPIDHPDRPGRLCNLGLVLQARFKINYDDEDRARAVALFVEAVGVSGASPSARVQAALGVLNSSPHDDHELAAQVLETAVELLGECVAVHLDRGDRQHALSRFGGLTAEAAAAALTARQGVYQDPAQRAGRATQLLEQGRSILVSQALETRTDLTDLHAQNPELAREFVALREQLDAPSKIEADGPDRRQTFTHYCRTLERIRSLPGLAGFLLPPTAEELTGQAAEGPLVVLNVAAQRSDALLVSTDGIEALTLTVHSGEAGEARRVPLTRDMLADQINSFHSAMRLCTNGAVTDDLRRQGQQQLHSILSWLWDAVTGPVLDHLGFTETPTSDGRWPRIWWVPGGLMGLLPLHAAGHHLPRRGQRTGETVLDRVVSSYTPTVRALRYAREARRNSANALESGPAALVVAMPVTPEAAPLPYTVTEAKMIARHLPDSIVEDSGTVKTEQVVAHLAGGCRIVHLACHALSDPADPSNSRLLLADHHTSPLTVNTIAGLRLQHADLAYLSACETALALPSTVLDESIHLASGFQMAGFAHVVATMWPVLDQLSANLADRFYQELQALSQPGVALHTDAAADALHQIVRSVRDQHLDHPSRWAPFIHAGI